MATVKFGFTVKQLLQDGRISQEDIDRLKSWLSTQIFPKLTDEQIALFLLSCDNHHDFTRITIRSYFATRNGCPALFTERTIKTEAAQKQLQTVEFCVFPQRTKEGCVILFHRLYDTLYSNYDMKTAMKLLFMSLDAAVYDYPPTGLVILFDMKGVGLMHLTRIKVGLIKVFFQYLQESLPVKLKIIHVLNSVYFLDKIMTIIRPFIRDEVMEMIRFHPVNMDMEMFYKKFLPKDCLPLELGGYLPSVRELHQQNTQKLLEMESFFQAEQHQRLIAH